MEWADNRTENEKRLEAKCAELEATIAELSEEVKAREAYNVHIDNERAKLEEAARAVVESKYVADSTDYGVIWSVGELEFDALAALITEKNDENDLRASLDALDAMWREKNDEYVPLP